MGLQSSWAHTALPQMYSQVTAGDNGINLEKGRLARGWCPFLHVWNATAGGLPGEPVPLQANGGLVGLAVGQ